MKINKPSLKIWLLFYSILVLIFSACSFSSSENNIQSTPVPIHLQDRSWLSGDPCSPPCWYGLDIDQSPEEEVLEVLSTIPFIVVDKMTTSEAGGGNSLTGEYYTVTKIQAPIVGNRSVVLKIGEGVLVSVWFSLNYDISLGEVVNIIGPPDVFEVVPLPDFSNGFCDLELFWLNKQLILSTRIDGKNWTEECGSLSSGFQPESNYLVDSVNIIYQDWLTAFLKDNRGFPWPGLK